MAAMDEDKPEAAASEARPEEKKWSLKPPTHIARISNPVECATLDDALASGKVAACIRESPKRAAKKDGDNDLRKISTLEIIGTQTEKPILKCLLLLNKMNSSFSAGAAMLTKYSPKALNRHLCPLFWTEGKEPLPLIVSKKLFVVTEFKEILEISQAFSGYLSNKNDDRVLTFLTNVFLREYVNLNDKKRYTAALFKDSYFVNTPFYSLEKDGIKVNQEYISSKTKIKIQIAAAKKLIAKAALTLFAATSIYMKLINGKEEVIKNEQILYDSMTRQFRFLDFVSEILMKLFGDFSIVNQQTKQSEFVPDVFIRYVISFLNYGIVRGKITRGEDNTTLLEQEFSSNEDYISYIESLHNLIECMLYYYQTFSNIPKVQKRLLNQQVLLNNNVKTLAQMEYERQKKKE